MPAGVSVENLLESAVAVSMAYHKIIANVFESNLNLKTWNRPNNWNSAGIALRLAVSSATNSPSGDVI